MNYKALCVLSCLSATTAGCATVRPSETPIGFNLSRHQSEEIVATYREGSMVVQMDIEIGTNEIILTTRDERQVRLLKFSMPLNTRPSLEPSRGSFLLEAAFNRLAPSRQVSLLLMHSKLSEELLRSVHASKLQQVQAMIKATPVMINLSLERRVSGRDPTSPLRVSWFSEADKCSGACGAGCGPVSVCACWQGLCLCLTSGFCQWHDRCCGAFLEFFDCKPDCLPTPFEVKNWI